MNSLFRKRKRVSILSVVLTAGLVIVLSISVSMLLFDCSVYMISGSSMLPDYPENSLVAIKKYPIEDLNVGDNIVFKSSALGGGLSFHRIVRVSDEGVYTKGDNSSNFDNQLITDENFVGKEVFSITFLAHYIMLIKIPMGFLAFFLLPLVSLTLIYIAGIIYKSMGRT